VIVKKILKRIQKAPKKAPLIVLDIPLLLERDSQFHIEPIMVVYTDPEIQKKRVQQKTGWSLEHIKKRIRSQLPLLEKVSKAQFVINNSGMLRETEEQAKALWPHLL
jgi:dephospho-CoA kinase